MERNYFYHRRKRKGFFALFILAAALVSSAAVMWLWNAILPDVLHVSKINYWQALGILALSRILFGGFRFGPPEGRRPPFQRPEFREKFMDMSPEERAAFKEKWKERCKR